MANDDPTVLPVRQSLVDLLEAADGMQPNLLPDPGHLDGPIPPPPKLNDWRKSFGDHELKGDEPSPEDDQKESQKKTDEENKKLKEERLAGAESYEHSVDGLKAYAKTADNIAERLGDIALDELRKGDVEGAADVAAAALAAKAIAATAETVAAKAEADAAAFRQKTINDFKDYEPIVIDLNHDGQLVTPPGSAMFDFNNDGFREPTAWFNPHDAVLVFDANGNNTVDGANELLFQGCGGTDRSRPARRLRFQS